MTGAERLFEVAIVREMVFVTAVRAGDEDEAIDIALQREGWADNGDYQSGDLRLEGAITTVEIEKEVTS